MDLSFIPFEPLHCLELLALGLVAGTLGGMTGVGGAIIFIPAMALFFGERYGPNSFHLYKLAAIIAALLTAIPSAIRHAQAKAIVFSWMPTIFAAGLVGVMTGVLAASFMVGDQTALLRRIFGGFLIFATVIHVWDRLRAVGGREYLRGYCPTARRRGVIAGVVGFPAGICSGLLGVGGGVWAVPAQHTVLGLTVRSAVANSAMMIIVLSIATSIVQSLAVSKMGGLRVEDGWWLAAFLGPGAMAGGWIGAGLAHKLPEKWVRGVFYLFLLATGIRMAMG